MRKHDSLLFTTVVAFLLAISWVLWSFTQTDPNLYYSSTNLWVQFQQTMWSLSRNAVILWYGVNLAGSFFLYTHLLSTKRVTLLWISVGLLLFGNNALSHDIYNYMFNAKALLVYHQDPHVLSAVEVAPHDDWVRFMHNVHTPAPYGHTWTYLSLVPFVLGMGKFIVTYLSFKLFMFVAFVVLYFLMGRIQQRQRTLTFFFANPLVLIETLLNGHNDVWMMLLAWGSLLLISQTKKAISLQTILSLGLLLLSTQIKEATLVLLPVWGLLLGQALKGQRLIPNSLTNFISRLSPYWADLAALFLFLPLVTSRSQQFNPWYLIWSLSFLPFVRTRWGQISLIVFSITSMLRYIPFLLVGDYTDTLQWQMRLITWSAIPISLIWYLIARNRTNHG